MIRGIYLFLLLIILLIVNGCANKSPEYVLDGNTMGTTYQVKIIADERPPLQLSDEIEQLLADINRQMSTWQPDSEISQFNNSPSLDWTQLSPGFASVMHKALQINKLSEGYFDPTVLPLIKLWGFAGNSPSVPTKEKITHVLSNIGMQHLELDGQRIRKLIPAIGIDLSAIAKGYAVDQIHDLIIAKGYPNVMVEIGGEVRASGSNSKRAPWQIAVRKPDTSRISAETVIELSGQAMATSGDYENYFEYQGRRYSHVIDPHTGYPPNNDIASVTVIANDCITADALATTLMLTNSKLAEEILIASNAQAILLKRLGSDFDIIRLPAN